MQNKKTIRNTQYGPVQGIIQDNTEIYYGIPYGADPYGELRWSAPVAPPAWEEVRDCTVPGSLALQMTTITEPDGTSHSQLTGSVACLNLDICTMPDANDLPVLVFVHGGNNQAGGSYTELTGNDIVPRDKCVYVSLNHRLGLLGFNNLPVLTSDGTTGNYGMQDIALALQWLRDNIAFFGGDPRNITISGFSAGGRNVMAMLLSPAFKGLFDKAITFSGGMTICDSKAAAKRDAQILAILAVEDGKADSEEAATQWLLQNTDEVREYLYQLSPERMTQIMSDAGIRMSVFPHLFGDDILLPSGGFEHGEYVNDVPVMMLTGTTEFSFFAENHEFLLSIEDETAQAVARRFAIHYGSEFYRVFNTQLSAAKMAEKYQSDLYLVQINYGNEDSPTKIPVVGSYHGIFLPMLTTSHNSQDLADFSAPAYQAMADTYHAYLKNFLYTGNPNGDHTPSEWPIWTPDKRQTLILDADEKTGTSSAIIRDVYKTNQEIIMEMEADDTVDEKTKKIIISTILNGRWFSDDLDCYYQNPDLW